MPSILAKNRTVAAPGFNRWLVPPAAPVDASLFTLAPAAGSQPVGFGQEPLTAAEPARSSNWPPVAAAWVLVALPLSWGVYNTISLALQMVQQNKSAYRAYSANCAYSAWVPCA